MQKYYVKLSTFILTFKSKVQVQSHNSLVGKNKNVKSVRIPVLQSAQTLDYNLR